MGQLLKSAFVHVFSLETAFVLMLYAGRFKADPRFEGLPDLTLIFLFLLSFALLVAILRHEFHLTAKGLRILVLPFIFVFWAATSLLWSPSVIYGPTKVRLLLIFFLLSFMISAFVIAPSPERFRRFCNLLVAFGVWNLVETIPDMLQSGAFGFANSFGGDYITFASTLALMTIILLLREVYSLKFIQYGSLFRLGFVLACLALIFASGARGAIVAMVLTLVPLFFSIITTAHLTSVAGIVRLRAFRLIILAAGLILVAPFWIDLDTFTSVQRFRVLTEQAGGGTSIMQRAELVNAALLQWYENPLLGAGAGSFGVYYGVGDIRAYPHNIFLEILGEFGLVGMIVFSILLLQCLLIVFRFGVTSLNFALSSAIFGFSLISALASSDITDNRFIFVGMGLLLSLWTGANSTHPARRQNLPATALRPQRRPR